MNDDEYVKFRGIKISNISYPKIKESIRSSIEKTGYVCLTCVGSVISSIGDERFRAAINESLISIADGMPLAWYGKLLGCRDMERISGMELMQRLIEEDNNLKHFLLGETEDTIKRLMGKARRKNKKIRISGFSPPFKETFDEKDNALMLTKIKEENPDIIWVSFGAPKQEKWMHDNYQKLDRGVMIGVGAAFRFYIGKITVPPRIFQRSGLQWVFRLAGEPKRFALLYMRDVPEFLLRFPVEVFKARRSKGLSGKSVKTAGD